MSHKQWNHQYCQFLHKNASETPKWKNMNQQLRNITLQQIFKLPASDPNTRPEPYHARILINLLTYLLTYATCQWHRQWSSACLFSSQRDVTSARRRFERAAGTPALAALPRFGNLRGWGPDCWETTGGMVWSPASLDEEAPLHCIAITAHYAASGGSSPGPRGGACPPLAAWQFFRQYINIITKPTAYDGPRKY